MIARSLSNESVALSKQQSFAFYEAGNIITEGCCLVMQSQATNALPQIYEGLDAFHKTGCQATLPFSLSLIAEANIVMGKTDDGHQALEDALAVISRTGERCWEAELRRLQGELLLQARDDARAMSQGERLEAATACFQQALTIARRQEAKSLELRAAMSLSRLWQQEGKEDEADKLLAPIYHWFTEGFDTADLMGAKALLDQGQRI